jgi:hypothetical protein
MIEDGYEWGSAGRERFTRDFGVIETIERITVEDNACSRKTKKTVRQDPQLRSCEQHMFRSRSCDGLCLAKQPPKKADVRRLRIALLQRVLAEADPRVAPRVAPLDGKAVMPYTSTC